jgi:hypothetical protein
MKKADIHLLFTGGYDSSFRLLEATIVENLVVQPHYIIDHRRRSKHLELRTMAKILTLLEKKFPEARKNVLETIFTHRKDIPKSVDDPKLHKLRKKMHIGDQYFWLVDYSNLNPTLKFELAVMKHEYLKENLSKYFFENAEGHGAECRLVAKPAIENLDVFKNFRFPILDVTKKEMLQKAKENNFADILLNCWSCHRPTIFNNPCGKCHPCKLAIENGFTQLFNKSALKRYKRSLDKA